VHVTASAIVVGDPPSPRFGVILHKHKRLGLWLQPGGHIDAGETPWQAARRETVEETGLPAELARGDHLLHVDVHPGPRGHTHLDLRYLLHAPLRPPCPPAGESQDVAWFAWREAVARADPPVEGVIRALQPGRPVLRRAANRDAAEMAHVYLRSREFAVPSVPCLHDEPDVRRWFADAVIGHLDTWVADLDGTIVGLMALSPGWIEQLYLDPAWIGRGLGDEFMRVAVERQPGGLQLWAFQANEPAHRFYARHGFAEAERTDGRGNEERAPDVRMAR
jgi:8-oxo-dGTP pyrophosphatase MutT (NUDIX family)